MKKLLAICLCLVSVVFAENTTEQCVSTTPKHEHRGFYYSFDAGLGLIFTHAEKSDNWQGSYYQEGTNSSAEYQDSENFDNWGTTFPTLEFKFGVAVANLIAFHTTFDLSAYVGGRDQSYDREFRTYKTDSTGVRNYTSGWRHDTDREYSDSYSSTILHTFVGLGATIYPFRNPNSTMNGFFVGGSVGYSGFFAYVEGESGDDYGFGISFKTEIGKDWWVSDNLSLGVSLEYTHMSSYIKSDGSENGFAILLRLTRG